MYLELPDLSRLTDALSSMPIVQLFHEEELRVAARPWVDLNGLDGNSVLREALELLEMPPEATATLAECLQDVRAASFSAVGLDPSASAHELTLLHQAHDQLWSLASVLDATASAGGLPESLDGLELPPDQLLDPWGHPFQYERAPDEQRTAVSADGDPVRYRLYSTGADGAAGSPAGDPAAADLSLDDSLELGSLALRLAPVGVELVLDFASPELASRAAQLLHGALSKARLEARPSVPLDLGASAGKRTDFFPPESLHLRPAWTVEAGTRLIVGWGSNAPEALVARARGVAAGLDDSPAYLRASTPVRSAGPLIAHGFSTDSVLGFAAAFQSGQGGEAARRALSFFDSPGPRAWRASADGGRLVTETFRPTPAEPGRPWLGGAPIDASLAPLVPADAMAVLVTSIDGAALGESLFQTLRQLTGTDTESWMLEFEQRCGYRPDRDLFGNLRGNLVAVCMPLRGLAAPHVSAFLDLEDPERFQGALAALSADVVERWPGLIRIVKRQHKDISLTMIDAGEGLGVADTPLGSLSPCLAVVDGRLLVTLTSIHAKREITRVHQEPTGPLHPLFAEGAPPLEGALLAFSMDWSALFLGIEALARTFGGMVAGQAGFDISSLPSVELLTRNLEPTLRVTRAVRGGTWTRHEASFGPETWLGLPALVAAAYGRHASAAEARADVLQITEETPEAEAQRVTIETLRDVKLGLGTYRAVTGRYPAELTELVAPTESFPKGFLATFELPCDGWGQTLRYASAADGTSYVLRSVGPDSVDQSGSGDDIVPP